MNVKSIMERCEKLYADLDLLYVREYKKERKTKAIGFLPIYVPREIIHASGMLPVGLMGAGSDLEVIKGDAYFQSYICHIPRSTIDLGLNGRLDIVDGFLFPAICDVIRNLSGMWKILFKNKYAKYIDFPQNFREDIGGEFYQSELKDLLEDMSTLCGAPVTADALNNSISLYNENRKMIESLYALRSEKPHLVPTHELYLLLRASNILEVSEHTKMLKEYAAAVAMEDRPIRDNIKVVLTGAFCEQPPLTLIKAIEISGCQIVEDDWVLGARFITGDVEITNDPIKSLSDAYLKHTVRTASRYEDDGNKGRFLLDQIKRHHAEGVIFAAPSFCDPALLERPMLQDVLNEEKIPHTAFQYAENTGQFQVMKEQTGTFADSIKLWSE